MTDRAAQVSIFEFSDHVRVALQLTYLINTLQPVPRCTLFLREDCREFMSSSSPLVGEVRFTNKYAMVGRFFFEAAILRRKALVSTGPESSGGGVQRLFARLMRLLKRRMSIFVIVRDLKAERGWFLLSPTLYSDRSLVAVESDALLQACAKAGYAASCYIYPTPINQKMMFGPKAYGGSGGRGLRLTLLLTGSLDTKRRNYDTVLEALATLRDRGIDVQLVVGGHCLSPTAAGVLQALRQQCDEVTATELLSDAELDAALLAADAIVCLNRPEFYGGIKGSGAIGDAFFAGKRLLIHADLAKPDSDDSRFYATFTDGCSLADHLLAVAANRELMVVPSRVLTEQSRRFAQLIGRWLRL